MHQQLLHLGPMRLVRRGREFQHRGADQHAGVPRGDQDTRARGNIGGRAFPEAACNIGREWRQIRYRCARIDAGTQDLRQSPFSRCSRRGVQYLDVTGAVRRQD